MKGIGATILLLLCGQGAQRWMLAIGVPLTIVGIAAKDRGLYPAAEPLFVAATVMGIVLTVSFPALLDAFLVRSLSAPSFVALIPQARLKLLLGAFGAQLLLALFIGVAVGMLTGAQVVLVFVLAFTCVSVFFVSLFWGMQSRPGMFLWLPCAAVPGVLAQGLTPTRLGAVLSSAAGMATLLSVSMLLWLIHGVLYLRTRRILVPQWNASDESTATAAATAAHYSRQRSIRILLQGYVAVPKAAVWIGWGFAVLLVVLVIIAGRASRSDAAVIMCTSIILLMAALYAGAMSGSLSRRARFLWLTAGMDRTELFATVESFGWRITFKTWGCALALVIPILACTLHAVPVNLRFWSAMALPFSTGAALTYASLMLVRGAQLTDNLVWGGFTALWAAENFVWTSQSLSATVPAILCAQIVAVPLLRALARRRWQSIDWLVHRPLESRALVRR